MKVDYCPVCEAAVVSRQEWIDGLTSLLWPGETVEEAGLALAEEAGEVARAIIKRNHAERGEGDRPPKDWTANLREEVADVVIVCAKIANREGFDLNEAVEKGIAGLEQRARAAGVLPLREVEHG